MRKTIITVAAVAALTANTQTVAAPSGAECAIWICLPYGFPAGCSSAKKAMFDRLFEFKSPIPTWGSCSVGEDGSHLEVVFGSYAVWNDPELGPVKVPDSDCDQGGKDAEQSQRCVSTINYIEVYNNGELVGEPYLADQWEGNHETADAIPVVEENDLTPEPTSDKPTDQGEDTTPMPQQPPEGGDR